MLEFLHFCDGVAGKLKRSQFGEGKFGHLSKFVASEVETGQIG